MAHADIQTSEWHDPPAILMPASAGASSYDGQVFRVNMPLPRPPHFAEREELDAALSAGTGEALKLFLERHPESRYRPEAESALSKLQSATPKR